MKLENQVVTYESCSFSERQTYGIWGNPIYEFNDTWASADSVVTASNCSGLSVGDTASTSHGRVSRVGNEVYFGFNGGISVASVASASSLSIDPIRVCVEGVEIRGSLSSSTMSYGTIVLNLDWTLIKNSCSFANPVGMDIIPPTSYAGVSTPAGTPSAVPSSAHSNQAYLVHFASQAGDWVGEGKTATYLPVAGAFSASRNYDNGVSISFNGNDNWWTLDFAAPNSAELLPGTYTGATRFPFQATSEAGLNVSGSGRGCNTLSGEFTILAVTYGAGNEVTSFAAEFVQHCEGGGPALYGSVRYNWVPPVIP